MRSTKTLVEIYNIERTKTEKLAAISLKKSPPPTKKIANLETQGCGVPLNYTLYPLKPKAETSFFNFQRMETTIKRASHRATNLPTRNTGTGRSTILLTKKVKNRQN